MQIRRLFKLSVRGDEQSLGFSILTFKFYFPDLTGTMLGGHELTAGTQGTVMAVVMVMVLV